MNNYEFINRMISEQDINMNGYKVLSVEPISDYKVVIKLELLNSDVCMISAINTCWFVLYFFNIGLYYDTIIMRGNKQIYYL